jgi:hypothetical protein
MTPMEFLDIWPPLPIVIMNELGQTMPENYNFDAAIIQRDRVFPALIHLLPQFDRNNSHAAPPHPRQ